MKLRARTATTRALGIALLLWVGPSVASAAEPEPAGDGDDTRPPVRHPLLEMVELEPSLQYRLRYRHLEGHDFVAGGVSDGFRHRARVGLGVDYEGLIGAMIQIQDVRSYGEETDPVDDFSANGLDAHQAYAFFSPAKSLRLRVGRQEIGLANERLIGKLDWAEQGRSFDGVRFTFDRGGTRVDALWVLTRDVGPGPGGAGLGSGLGGAQSRRHLAGFLVGHELLDALHPTAIGVLESDTATGRRMVTAGALMTGELGGLLGYGLEGYYQGGKHSDGISQSAFLFAGHLRTTLQVRALPYLELYSSFSSGDDNTADRTIKTFVTPYATSHDFFGEMDFFVDLRRDTDDRGLRDIGGALGARPLKDLDVRAAHHLFHAMAPRGDLEAFGHELDLRAQYRFLTYARVAAFYGVFFPGNLKRAPVVAKGGSVRAEHFAYTTVDLKFE